MKKEIYWFMSVILIILLIGCSPSSDIAVEENDIVESQVTPTLTPEPVPTEPTIPEYYLAEYTSSEVEVNPEIETKISLEDGASIIIPANSFIDTTQVKIERNPEKINDLPPLDGNIIQLSDFYNYEVAGELLSPIDLIIPFDSSFIPDGQIGILTMAIPTENGWEYIPVTPEEGGDFVRIYTDNVGDPLIAWHFTEIEDRTMLGNWVNGSVDYPNLCEKTINVSVSKDRVDYGEEFTVSGRLVPQDINHVFYANNDGDLSYAEVGIDTTGAMIDKVVEIEIKHLYPPQIEAQTFSVISDENGNFSLTHSFMEETGFTYEEIGYAVGRVRFDVKAACASWPLTDSLYSTGNGSIYLSRQKDTETDTPSEDEENKPEGAVEIPELISLSFDDAKSKLSDLGFGYTWIDGSSTYSLGDVYNQAPAAGEYHVPHRTTVLLYRTVEQDYCSLDGLWEGKTNFVGGDGTYKIRLSGISDCNYTGQADTGGAGWTCSFDMIHQDKNVFYFFENSDFVIVSDTVAIKCGWNGYLSIEDGKIIMDNDIILEKID